MTGKAVSPKIAMTGEVSLRGFVMPIGGLPEKLMEAQRAGITTVFIPIENENDLDEVPSEVKNSLEIIPVHRIGDVTSHIYSTTHILFPEFIVMQIIGLYLLLQLWQTEK